MAEALKIELPRIDIRRMEATIIGDSPLICHAWSAKAKKAMLDKHMKRARQKKEVRDPEAELEACFYRLPDGRAGMPATAFKRAMVAACRFVDGVKMTELRGALHVVGELVAIEGASSPREDMVTVGLGKADLRFRPEFREWKATLAIDFNAAVISPEQIINLLTLAGFGVGIGEWRPERDGQYGRFHVATEEPQNGEDEKSRDRETNHLSVEAEDQLPGRHTKSRRGTRSAAGS
jgi:hypothetical protein